MLLLDDDPGTTPRGNASYEVSRLGQLLAFLLTLAAAACGGDEPSASHDIFLPTEPIGDDYPTGLMEGVLEVRSGCVFISAHGDEGRALRLIREDHSLPGIGDSSEAPPGNTSSVIFRHLLSVQIAPYFSLRREALRPSIRCGGQSLQEAKSGRADRAG